jgi:membrane associated rhomboid family serine protease
MLPLRDRLPTRKPPIVNWLIIAGNVAVFVWMQAILSVVGPQSRELAARDILMHWGLVPLRLLQDPVGAVPTVLSSMFMHDPTSWMHLGGNMLYLWIFGDNVEDAMGSKRYALFYLACGVGAAAAQILVDPTSAVPMVGASGAISGVLAAYGTLYPRSPITVLNPVLPLWFIFGFVFELPAWVIILEYFVVNLFSGLGSLGGTGGGVAFFAHLGGFLAGVLLARLFMINRKPQEHDRWSGFRAQSRRQPPPRYPYDPPYGQSPRRPGGGADPWGW